MTTFIPRYFIFTAFSFLIFSLAQADTLRKYHQRECNKGVEESCKKAEAMLQGERLGERIVELGDHFAGTVDRLKREENNKPIQGYLIYLGFH